MFRVLALPIVGLIVQAALAQSPITWRTDPAAAIAEAKRTGKPILVYVLASSRDRDDKIEAAQKRSLADPRVLQRVQSFVPLRLSRSVHSDILGDFHLPQTANMMMSFVTPNGERIDTLGAGGIEQVDSLILKLDLVLRSYRQRIYAEQIKPVLEAEEVDAKDLREAVERVGDLRITEADQLIIKLLDRPRLDQPTRTRIFETLALLSTKAGIEKLLELSSAGNKLASRALEKGTPEAAEIIVERLDPNAEPFAYDLYKVVTKICNIQKVKPETFFEKGKLQYKQEEVDRVRELVREAARQWREASATR